MQYKTKSIYSAALVSGSVLAILSGCGAKSDGADSSGRVSLSGSEVKVYSLLGLPVTLNFSLTLAASVTPPTVTGTLLQADEVTLDGTLAYVSYNVAGDVQKGAIDQIQTLVPAVPIIQGTQLYTDSDIHGVVKSGNSLYAVGAQTNNGAILYKSDLVLGLMTSATPASTYLRSYAGTAATVIGSTVYTASGDGSGSSAGGLDFFNSTTLASTATGVNLYDLRGISYNAASASGHIFMVTGASTGGGNSKLLEYTTGGVSSYSYDLGAASNNITQSKSTVASGKTLVGVSKGTNGFQIFCASDHASVVNIAGIDLSSSGTPVAKTPTNSVTFGPGLIFSANGEAGVYVYAFTKTSSSGSACGTYATSLLGKLALGTGVSANSVKYQALTLGVVGLSGSTGVLYVSTGAGFKMINIVQVNTAADVTDFN